MRLLNLSFTSPEQLRRLHEGLSSVVGRRVGVCAACGLSVTDAEETTTLHGQLVHAGCAVHQSDESGPRRPQWRIRRREVDPLATRPPASGTRARLENPARRATSSPVKQSAHMMSAPPFRAP